MKLSKELKAKLIGTKSLEELKACFAKAGIDIGPEDLEEAWSEISRHREDEHHELDEKEMEAVSGGVERNWASQGCAASCEKGSHCFANDKCEIWQVIYEDFHRPCKDGGGHDYQEMTTSYGIVYWKCRKCGKLG